MRRVLTGWFNWSNRSETSPALDQLTLLVRRFSVEQQQVPKDLAELVALNYLEALPPAPSGKKFVIDRRKVKVRLDPADVGFASSTAKPNPGVRPGMAPKPDENLV